MNKKDRKELNQAMSLIEEVKALIETLGQNEREKYDNMPEGLQQGERGQAMDESATCLENCLSSLEEAFGYAEEALGG